MLLGWIDFIKYEHMSLELDLYYADPAQHAMSAG